MLDYLDYALEITVLMAEKEELEQELKSIKKDELRTI